MEVEFGVRQIPVLIQEKANAINVGDVINCGMPYMSGPNTVSFKYVKAIVEDKYPYIMKVRAADKKIADMHHKKFWFIQYTDLIAKHGNWGRGGLSTNDD